MTGRGCGTSDQKFQPIEILAVFLRRFVREDSKIVVGLSGGLDSVALLYAFHQLIRENQCSAQLKAVHVHHGLSAHADTWADFCCSLCSALAVPCEVVRVDVDRGSKDGLEGAARRARHAVFNSSSADWIFLAHHLNDQAETVLFKLMRGAGLLGASGMRPRRGKLLRPWLTLPREEIKAFALANGLAWIEDESNADLRYSRNFLRNCIFPVIDQQFPAATRNIALAAERFDEARLLLDELAVIDLGDADAVFPLSTACIANLSEPRARNLLRYLLQLNNIPLPSAARISEAVAQFRQAKADRHPVISFGARALVRRGQAIHLQSSTDCLE